MASAVTDQESRSVASLWYSPDESKHDLSTPSLDSDQRAAEVIKDGGNSGNVIRGGGRQGSTEAGSEYGKRNNSSCVKLMQLSKVYV